jgi:putative oxidoreductase
MHKGCTMKRRVAEYGQIQREITRFLARYSVPFLRVSLGLVFLGFGLLKFVPGVSPAEDISARTVDALSLGIVEGRLATVVVAAMETAIGLCLVTGRRIKIGLALLGAAMVGVLSPLALFPGDLFDGRYHAPTLVGQYVLKDVVLLAGTLVVVAWELNRTALMGPGQPGGAHN